jgi:hypothetical protein
MPSFMWHHTISLLVKNSLLELKSRIEITLAKIIYSFLYCGLQQGSTVLYIQLQIPRGKWYDMTSKNCCRYLQLAGGSFLRKDMKKTALQKVQ